ncbi:LysR family transcriptional regulator [Kribbella lupini]|uniref:LysR family transcriptional regulator n=1 Tax=Kribbella lupini TaxID=291602 RepID=UPI0031DEAA83
MNVDHLRTAIALVQHGTVNRTAAVQGLAASSVSDRVRRLEADLGAPLFTRDRSGMRPTVAGRAYLAAAGSALEALDAAAEQLTSADSVVVVGAQASIADALLPGVLDDLRRRRPELVAQLRPEPDRAKLLSALERGELDAALLLDTGSRIGELGYAEPEVPTAFVDVREVPMVTVASAGHPLLGRPVAAAEIRDGATLVGQESRCSFWLATQRWLGPEVDLISVGGLAQVREWVAAGRGVAVLPDFVVRGDLEAGRLGAVDTATPPLQLRLLWRETPDESEPLRSLLYALSQV